jgi:hypothetical protein
MIEVILSALELSKFPQFPQKRWPLAFDAWQFGQIV